MQKRYIVIVALLVVLSTGKANATEFIVNDFTTDTVSPSTPGTLRYAIDMSNGSPGYNTILFDNSASQTIILSSPFLTPSQSLNGSQVVFSLKNPGSVTLSISTKPTNFSNISLLEIGSTGTPVVIPTQFNIDAQGSNHVNAIYGLNYVNIYGDYGGNISAVSQTGDYARGIYAENNDLTIKGYLVGHVSAETTVGSLAYGMYAKGNNSGGDLSIGGLIAGSSVIAISGSDGAIGLAAHNNLLISGDMAGQVSARAVAGDFAYALVARNNLTIKGYLVGHVSAEAPMGSMAFGKRLATNDSVI